jgi:hypothetical protein
MMAFATRTLDLSARRIAGIVSSVDVLLGLEAAS